MSTTTHDTHQWKYEFGAGAFAGLIADYLLYPLDTTNLREKTERVPPYRYGDGPIKSLRRIWCEEGGRGLYAGASTNLISSLPSAGIWFASYEAYKRVGYETAGTQNKSVVHVIHLTAGALAELSCSVIEVPCEIIRSRQQLQGHPLLRHRLPYRYSGPIHAFCNILRHEGVSGLFVGYKSSIALDCSYAALQFAFYEHLKASLMVYRGRELDSKDSLCCGALAGGASAFLTNPLDSITCRLQTQGSKVRYRGVWHAAKTVFREQGVHGLYKGATSRVLYLSPQSAIAWACYEFLKRYVFVGCLKDDDEQ